VELTLANNQLNNNPILHLESSRFSSLLIQDQDDLRSSTGHFRQRFGREPVSPRSALSLRGSEQPQEQRKRVTGKERKNEERNEIIGKNDKRPAKENGFGEKKTTFHPFSDELKDTRSERGEGERKNVDLSAAIFWFLVI